MSKKSLRLQTNRMLAAALFTMLCVGIYAHVDGWVTKKELTKVLGTETSTTATSQVTTNSESSKSGLWKLMLCRLKYGTKCDQMLKEEEKKAAATVDVNMTTDQLIERELKNLENEIKNDGGANQSSNYWSM